MSSFKFEFSLSDHAVDRVFDAIDKVVTPTPYVIKPTKTFHGEMETDDSSFDGVTPERVHVTVRSDNSHRNVQFEDCCPRQSSPDYTLTALREINSLMEKMYTSESEEDVKKTWNISVNCLMSSLFGSSYKDVYLDIFTLLMRVFINLTIPYTTQVKEAKSGLKTLFLFLDHDPTDDRIFSKELDKGKKMYATFLEMLFTLEQIKSDKFLETIAKYFGCYPNDLVKIDVEEFLVQSAELVPSILFSLLLRPSPFAQNSEPTTKSDVTEENKTSTSETTEQTSTSETAEQTSTSETAEQTLSVDDIESLADALAESNRDVKVVTVDDDYFNQTVKGQSFASGSNDNKLTHLTIDVNQTMKQVGPLIGMAIQMLSTSMPPRTSSASSTCETHTDKGKEAEE